ncbi:MAG: hypothetical protein ACP5QB_13700, partial [Thiomonas sp.]
RAPPAAAQPVGLQLKLETQLNLVALAAAQPERAQQAASALPPWWDALLHALQDDEQHHQSQSLLTLLDAHAQEIRARADAPLAARLGWALYRAQHFEQAAQWFALARAKDDTAASAQQGEFYALQRAGQLEQAFAAGEGDAQLQSARADVAVQLALHAREHGDAAQAVRWLREAITLGKDDDALRALLAWSLLQSGEPAQAADLFAQIYA